MNRELIAELGYEDSIVFENPDYDDAIIGVDIDGRVIYDYEKMISHLCKFDNMTEEEAADFINYNTFGVLKYAGEKAPIILFKL